MADETEVPVEEAAAPAPSEDTVFDEVMKTLEPAKEVVEAVVEEVVELSAKAKEEIEAGAARVKYWAERTFGGE